MKKQLLLWVFFVLCGTVAANGQACSGSFTVAAGSNFCIGDSITITISDTSYYGNYVFDWGNGSRDTTNLFTRKHSVGGLGTDTFIVYRYDSTSTCMDSLLVIFTVHKPTAAFSFSPDSACAGTAINFTNSSSGTGLSYSWNFNDPASGGNNSSGSQDPSHSYNSAVGNGYGSYQPQLIITDTYGCKDTAVNTIYSKRKPDLNLSGNLTNCQASLSSQSFQATLYNATISSVSSYIINWGDGAADTLTSWFQQNHTYSSLGEFTVVVTATGSNGCVAVDSMQVVNETAPSVSLTIPSNASACSPQQFTFHTSPTNVSPSTRFVWIFGGRDTVYWDYNDYLAHYDSVNSRASLNYVFDTTSCGTNLQIGSTNYQNSFGVEIFALNACYTDISNPATSAIGGPIKICQVPVVDLSANDTIVCINQNVTFSNNTPGNCEGSTTLTCNGTTIFFWDFGDGNTSISFSRNSQTHSYSSPGIYQVKLKVQNNCGTDSIYQTVRVDSTPVASFTYTSNLTSQCANAAVQLTNTSTGGFLSSSWSISPSTGRSFTTGTDTSTHPVVTFTQPGNYTISLTVTNECSSSTAQQTITIKDVPEVLIAPIAAGCESYLFIPASVVDTNHSTVSAYLWTFSGGTPSSSATRNPGSVTYNSAGNYSVTFSVTNECGTTTDTVNFTVHPKPTVSAGSNDTFCASDATVALSGYSPSGGSWSGTGISGNNFSPQTAGPGKFNLVYSVTDNNGCSNSDTVEFVVDSIPTVEAGPNDTICFGSGTLTLSGYSPSGGTWSGTGITNASSGIFDPAVSGVGNFTVNYSYTHPTTGCSAIDSKFVQVDTIPIVAAGADVDICADAAPFNLSGSPSGGTWTGNGITNSSAGTFSVAVAGTGLHEVVYTYSDPSTGCQNKDTLQVVVRPFPVVDFSVNDTGQCLSGNSFSFTNSSSIGSGTMNHKWYFGDGDSASTTNTSHTYTATDTFIVLLVSTSNFGCADTAQQQVMVFAMPAAAFTYDTACFGEATNFTNQSSISNGSISSYKWYFGDGDSSSANSPSHTFTAAGAYSVQLITESIEGCFDTITESVNVGHIPMANFGALDVCLGGTTVFSDSSSISGNSISSRKWYFGDGDSASSTNPSHEYATSDTFTVLLIAKSNFGCKDSVTKDVIIRPGPLVNFSVDDTGQCFQGNSFSFTNGTILSSGTTTYLWSFGDGDTSTSSNATHNYSTANTYAVKLVASSSFGCSDSLTRNVYVYPEPVADFSVNDSDQCFLGNSFGFTSTGTSASSYTWHFGDNSTGSGSTATHSYASADTFTVKLVISTNASCSDSIERKVYIRPMPVAAYTIDNDSQCLNGNSFAFTNTSSISSGNLTWLWNFGDTQTSTDTNTTHSYSSENLYNTSLIATSTFGCKDTAEAPIVVHPQPNAAFVMDDSLQCVGGNSFSFTNNTSISSGSFGSLWTFGDGNGSSSTSPSHSYATYDTFDVKLITTSTFGCEDSSQRKVYTVPDPLASFSISDSSQCLNGNSFSFSNGSSISSGTINHKWYFGDGDSASTANPTHSYSTADTFTVRLVVTSDNNCVDSFSRLLIVNPMPVAAFTFDTVCFEDQTNFTNQSTGTSSQQWLFGDATSSTQQHPQHQYASGGTYTVELKLESNEGCRDSITNLVDVGYIPIANFGAPAVCVEAATIFSDSSGISSGNSIVSRKWYFGDGDSSSATNPNHTYATHDTFTVVLWAESNFGCHDSVAKQVIVHPEPLVNFFVNDTAQCELGNNFIFTNNTTIGSGSMSYLWSYGDGGSSTDTNTTRSYSGQGTYPVNLVVTSGFGCKDSLTKNVHVNPEPVASFAINDTDQCLLGNSFSFTNNSTGNSVSTWYFGEGNSTNTGSPTYSYSIDDTFTVKLLVGTSAACSDSIEKKVYIRPMPVADYTIDNDSQCLTGNSFTFTNTSSISSGNLTWLWSFDDTQTSTATIIIHSYGSENLYNTGLIATSGFGCKDTAEAPVVVHPMPITAFAINDTLQCVGANNFSFTNNTSISSGNFGSVWTFGDGNGSTSTSPNHSYASVDTFDVKLITTSTFGCADSAQKKVYTAPGPVADFSIADSSQCLTGNSFSFSNQSNISGGSISYKWYFGDGDSSSAQNPTHSYSAPGTYNVQLVVRSNHDCPAMLTKQVVVHPMPAAAFAVVDSVQCFGVNLFGFTNNTSISSGSFSSLWVFGDGDSSTTTSPSHSYLTVDTFMVSLFAESTFGCRDSIDQFVRTTAEPVANFSILDSSQCLTGNSFNFTSGSSISSGSISHKWYFGDGDSSFAINPTHSYTAADTFLVKLFVISDNSCIDSFSNIVNVHPMPVAAFSFDTACYGDTTVFANNSNISSGIISNNKWYFGDGDSSLLIHPQHFYASAGLYDVELKVESAEGCRDSLTQKVDVGYIPVANFGASPVCMESLTQFSDSSNISGNSITGRKWYFGDGDSSSNTNPTHTYATHDTFNVMLVAESMFGCKDTSVKQVIVYPEPLVNFSVNDTVQCILDNSFIFTNNSSISSGNFTNVWRFGDNNGSTNLSDTHSYAAQGTYAVKLVATSNFGCTDSLTRDMLVNPMPVAVFSADSLYCAGINLSFTNNSTGATDYLWVFGDGDSSVAQAPSHPFADTGVFMVTLYSYTGYGCADTLEQWVHVIDTPEAAMVLLPDSGCGPLTVFFGNNTVGYVDSFLWNFGDGTGSYTQVPDSLTYQQGTNDTTYYLTLRAQNMCGSNTAEDSVLVIPSPRADFGIMPPYGCSPLTVMFSNKSTGLPQTFFWNFGDSSSSTKQHPNAHTYFTDTLSTEYFITLFAYNQCGVDSMSKNLVIEPNTVRAFFELDTMQGCAPLTVQVTDYSRGGNNISYTMSDGNSFNQKNFTHTFDSAGTYTIQQFVNNGCSYDTVLQTIQVFPNPQLQFTISDQQVCEDAVITFTNTTLNSAGQTWYFGDGDSAFSTIALHSYDSAGTYTVTMRATTMTHGCVGEITDTVNVQAKPQISFSPDNTFGCQPLEVQFTNNTNGGSFYTWSFDDGNTSGVANPQHTFTDTGDYSIKLVSESSFGCVDSGFGLVRVFVKPQARFVKSVPAGCDGLNVVNFSNASIDANSYLWHFGNGDSSTNVNPTATYSVPQTYTVRLVAANNYGCSDTAFDNYTVYPQPVADFDADPKEGCQPLLVNFLNNSHNAQNFLWRFGDGDTSTQSAPSHWYRDPGTYTITLVANNGNYCFDSITQTLVEVWPKPIADFNYRFINIPQAHGLVHFFDSSQGAVSHSWAFGDGGTSDQLNPQHRYPTPGSYTINLYITSDKGCLDTTVKVIEVLPYFHGLFVPNAFTPNSGPFEIREWKPVGVWLQKYHVQVFTTWGEMIWESTELDAEGRPVEGWDGTWKGEPMPQDAYVWKINAIFMNGQAWPGMPDKHGLHKKMGSVTLIR